jgi:excisionase family DNA binding protein
LAKPSKGGDAKLKGLYRFGWQPAARDGKALRMAGLFLYAHERWIMDYISIAEAAAKWNITRRRVQVLCNEGRIPGLTRFGKAWAIPRDAVKPADARKTKSVK